MGFDTSLGLSCRITQDVSWLRVNFMMFDDVIFSGVCSRSSSERECFRWILFFPLWIMMFRLFSSNLEFCLQGYHCVYEFFLPMVPSQAKMPSGLSSRLNLIPTLNATGSSTWRGRGIGNLLAFSSATLLDTRSTWATLSMVNKMRYSFIHPTTGNYSSNSSKRDSV